MIPSVFVVLVPFAFVTLSYVECYGCSSTEVQKGQLEVANDDENKAMQEDIDKARKNKYGPGEIKPIPGREMPTGDNVNQSAEKRFNIRQQFTDLPTGQYARKPFNYGFSPISLEELYASKEEAKMRDALAADQFKRKMAGEVYLLWKHLEGKDK